MSISSLTPTKLRVSLSLSLVLIAGIGVGLFYVANRQLQTIADDVSKITVDANVSRNNIQTLETIQEELTKRQDVIKRADEITASSQDYDYQNQIIRDLNTYASRADVAITNIDFASASASGGTSTPAAGAATPPPAVAEGDTNAAAPSGLQTANISVTLKSPVNYTNLLNFFNMLEQSVPKLQMSKINLTKSSEGSGVSSDVLNIEVYIR